MSRNGFGTPRRSHHRKYKRRLAVERLEHRQLLSANAMSSEAFGRFAELLRTEMPDNGPRDYVFDGTSGHQQSDLLNDRARFGAREGEAPAEPLAQRELRAPIAIGHLVDRGLRRDADVPRLGVDASSDWHESQRPIAVRDTVFATLGRPTLMKSKLPVGWYQSLRQGMDTFAVGFDLNPLQNAAIQLPPELDSVRRMDPLVHELLAESVTRVTMGMGASPASSDWAAGGLMSGPYEVSMEMGSPVSRNMRSPAVNFRPSLDELRAQVVAVNPSQLRNLAGLTPGLPRESFAVEVFDTLIARPSRTAEASVGPFAAVSSLPFSQIDTMFRDSRSESVTRVTMGVDDSPASGDWVTEGLMSGRYEVSMAMGSPVSQNMRSPAVNFRPSLNELRAQVTAVIPSQPRDLVDLGPGLPRESFAAEVSDTLIARPSRTAEASVGPFAAVSSLPFSQIDTMYRDSRSESVTRVTIGVDDSPASGDWATEGLISGRYEVSMEMGRPVSQNMRRPAANSRPSLEKLRAQVAAEMPSPLRELVGLTPGLPREFFAFEVSDTVVARPSRTAEASVGPFAAMSSLPFSQIDTVFRDSHSPVTHSEFGRGDVDEEDPPAKLLSELDFLGGFIDITSTRLRPRGSLLDRISRDDYEPNQRSSSRESAETHDSDATGRRNSQAETNENLHETKTENGLPDEAATTPSDRVTLRFAPDPGIEGMIELSASMDDPRRPFDNVTGKSAPDAAHENLEGRGSALTKSSFGAIEIDEACAMSQAFEFATGLPDSTSQGAAAMLDTTPSVESVPESTVAPKNSAVRLWRASSDSPDNETVSDRAWYQVAAASVAGSVIVGRRLRRDKDATSCGLERPTTES